ncbi:TPA: hypothetical protein ENS27_16065 [bacterium]|nr:hypothetical protein [bacterium]
MGIKGGTVKVLELGMAAIIGAFAAKLVDILIPLSGWTLVLYSFIATAALLGYCALALGFIYGVEWITRRRSHKEEK